MIDIKITDKREQTIEELVEQVKILEDSDAVKLALRESEIRRMLCDRLQELHKLHARGLLLKRSGAADYIRDHFE